MKRFMTIISALSILAMATSAFGADYGSTLSGSITDPFDHQTPIGTPGTLANVYLHYVCNNDIGAGTGMGAYESGFTFSASPIAANTNPVAVFANVGDSDDLILSMQGCQSSGNWLVNWLFIETGLGVSACYRPTDPIPGSSQTIAAIDCDFPAVFHPTDYVGFDNTAGGSPCSNIVPGPNPCDNDPIAVESSSWGSVKGLYR